MQDWREEKGIRFLLEFWKQMYLQEYIPSGGSKIKFLTGKYGSGKTYALQQVLRDADELGYRTVSFSAEEVYLNDFKDIYVEIIRQTDILATLRKCVDEVLRSIGMDPTRIPEGRTALDYYTSTGEMSVILRGELREVVTNMFLKNRNMDHYFAQVCALIVSSMLGLFSLDEESVQLLVGWMLAKKEVRVSALKPLGVSPARINKMNARHMLRSLCEVVKMSGAKGLVVAVDDLDILLNRSGNGIVKYAKVKRDDTYEIIRQLIDDIDTMHNILFVFAFDRAMLEDEKAGLKSYQALWMRIQNEVLSRRFNRFADIADLDRMANSSYCDAYSDNAILKIASGFAEQALSEGKPVAELDPEEIQMLRQQAHDGTVGLPLLVKRAVEGGDLYA